MTATALVAFLLFASNAEPPAAESLAETKFREAQAEFNRGDFQGALKTLDNAATQTMDSATLSRIQLLRGQCFAARQDFAHAEQAFGQALWHDPEATLDPFKVDPAVVRLLESLRGRLRGDLSVTADRIPAEASLDGRHLGGVPLKTSAPIGRHMLEVRTTDGRLGAREEVVIRPKQQTVVAMKLIAMSSQNLAAKSTQEAAGRPEGIARPFADLRGVLAPFASSEVGSFEVGGGLEIGHLRASVHAAIPVFGLTLRGAFGVPVNDTLRLCASVETPFLFDGGKVGFGGAAGVENEVSRWLGWFAEIGVRHFFNGFGNEPNRLVLQFGTRLRLP